MKKSKILISSLLLILLVACLTPPLFATNSIPSTKEQTEQEGTPLTKEEIALLIPPGVYSKSLVVDLVWEQYQLAQKEIVATKADAKIKAEEAVKIAVVPLLAEIKVLKDTSKPDTFTTGFICFGVPIITILATLGGVWLGSVIT